MQDDDPWAALRLATEEAIRYRTNVAARGLRPRRDHAALVADFDGPTPETPGDPLAVIAELVEKAEPGLMAMTSPRFFGWVVGAAHPAGLAADWLTGAWGQNAVMHAATPAAAAAEEVAAAWLLDLLDLPRQSAVGFVTGATAGNFAALTAARDALLAGAGWDSAARGLFGAPEIHVFAGAEAHVSVLAALHYCGLGRERVRRATVDAQGRMDPVHLDREMRACDGPKIVVAQAGHVVSGAFDPLGAVAEIAAAHGAWLHVDGAFGLWARAAPARAALAAGAERADSWVTDGHKWPQLPFDSGFVIMRDGAALGRAMAKTASYLPTGGAQDRTPSGLVPELSRRARGFAVWAMLKTLGRAGIAELVERHCRIAGAMAERLRGEPGIAVLNDVVLNQLALGFGATDAPAAERDRLTDAVIAQLQADDVCYAGGADWQGRRVMRISVIGGSTTEAEGLRAAEAIVAAWRVVAD